MASAALAAHLLVVGYRVGKIIKKKVDHNTDANNLGEASTSEDVYIDQDSCQAVMNAHSYMWIGLQNPFDVGEEMDQLQRDGSFKKQKDAEKCIEKANKYMKSAIKALTLQANNYPVSSTLKSELKSRYKDYLKEKRKAMK